MPVDFIVLSLSIILFLATTATSQSSAGSEIIEIVGNAICVILRVLQGIAAGVAAFMIIWEGVKWMTSEDPAGRKSAKDTITHVFVALIIIIIAVQFVNYLVTGTGVAEFTSCPEFGIAPPTTIPAGGKCTISGQCGSTAYCRKDGTCQNKRAVNEECSGDYAAIDKADNACKSGYYCSASTGTCKEWPNTPPLPQITEKTTPALECLKFTLHGSIADTEEGSSCCKYEWVEVDCNTGNKKATLLSGTGSAPVLEYTYPKESAGEKCIELWATDSKGLESKSGKPYAKVYVSSNNEPKINEIKLTYPNNRIPDYKAAINEEFTLEADIASEGDSVKDKNIFDWSTNPADCTVVFNPNNNEDAKKTTAKITESFGSDECKITLKVTDSCNQVGTKDVNMLFISNQRPTANIRFSSDYVPAGESVTFIGSDSRAGGDCPATGSGSVEVGDKIDKYEWRWTGPSNGTAKGEKPSLTLGEKNGQYTVYLKVTDLHGAQCERSVDTLVVCENLPDTNDAPIADASATAKVGTAGVAFTLDASNSYDPDNFNPGPENKNPENAIQCPGSGTQGAQIERYYWRMTREHGISVDKCVPGCNTGPECYVKTPKCTYTPSTGDYEFELKVEDDAFPGVESETSSKIMVKINPP